MIQETLNTKVETVVEAFEDLTNAIIDGRNTDRKDKAAVDHVTSAILDCRTTLSTALRNLVQPNFRVITGGLHRQDYTGDTDATDKPLCETCLKKHPCATLSCEHWAAAVRRKHNEVVDMTPGDVA